jgi:hypothetical protein
MSDQGEGVGSSQTAERRRIFIETCPRAPVSCVADRHEWGTPKVVRSDREAGPFHLCPHIPRDGVRLSPWR